MNYALLEDEIVARLAPIVTAGHEVEAIPFIPSENSSIKHKGRITIQVGAAKGDVGDIQSQSSTSDQYEDVFVEIIIRSKRLRSNGGYAGIYDLSELARKLLQGWKSTMSFMPFEYVDFTPLSPDVITDSIFTWSLRMKTQAFLPAQLDDDLSVLIQQITILPDSETGPLAPFGEIFASAYSVASPGDQVTLAWISENGYSVSINGVGADLEDSGSATISVSANTTYTLTVVRGATVFEVSVSVTVGVVADPVTEQINGIIIGTSASGSTNNQEIQDTLGNPIGTAANPSVVGDATVENSDASYSATVEAEGTKILPDSTITLKDTAAATLSTTVVPATNSVDITAPNATVENSDASYTTTVASGATLVLPNITVTDSDGTTSSVPSVQDVTCTPQVKSLFIKFGFQSGDDITGTLTIDADNAGTFTSTSDNGSSGTITYNVNGGGFAAFVNPTVLGIGDTIAAQRTITTGAGFAKITGTYV